MSLPNLDTLRDALPGLRLLTDANDLAHYGRDWTRRWTPAPFAIALPASVDEVVGIVRWAREARVALVPSGGRTGLSGGAVAANGELVVSLERMNRVIGFDPVDRLLHVQAGITLQAAQDAMARLQAIDFGAKDEVAPGAVVRIGNQRFVMAVATRPFQVGGETFMGVSLDAPLYLAARGKSAGDAFTLGGTPRSIDSVE